MGKSEKQIEKEKARNQRIIDTAFQIFVEKKIEAVTMEEIARKAGIGRATLFRCYSSKPELVMAVCTAKWKAYFDKLDAIRPLESIHDIPAIDRFIFTLDGYIDMYQNHKDLLQYNDNFNHYMVHQEGIAAEKYEKFYKSLYSMNTRLHWMYEKAKEDKTFRTDIPEEQLRRVECSLYARTSNTCSETINMSYWGNGFCAVAGEDELNRGRGFGDRS